jgi:transposase
MWHDSSNLLFWRKSIIIMERIHMNYLHDLIYRLRAGESERRIARDLKVSRPTVHKYKLWAEKQGYLDLEQPLPELAALLAALGPVPQPPQMRSTLAPHQAVVEQLLDQGVEMTAIWQRLQENYGYKGSYSAVRRFVRRLRPVEPEAFVRVHSAPGEELQVDFGSIGQLFDPLSGRPRRAYVFVATLGYSRHQYAELVFDQKVPTVRLSSRRSLVGLAPASFRELWRCTQTGRAGQPEGGSKQGLGS